MSEYKLGYERGYKDALRWMLVVVRTDPDRAIGWAELALQSAEQHGLPVQLPVQTTSVDEIRQRMTSVGARNRSKNR